MQMHPLGEIRGQCLLLQMMFLSREAMRLEAPETATREWDTAVVEEEGIMRVEEGGTWGTQCMEEERSGPAME